jgi:hypothetical protein
MTFDDWLKDFTRDKREVGSADLSATHAIHTVRRFIDRESKMWEIAFTYTGRLVVRYGIIEGPDGVTITWSAWVTRHDVDISSVS